MSDISEPLRSLLADDNMPKPGETWRSHEGVPYRVITLSAWQADRSVVLITLRSLQNGTCETLPLADFLAPMLDANGRGVPRYRQPD
jgi:hypothetical protein